MLSESSSSLRMPGKFRRMSTLRSAGKLVGGIIAVLAAVVGILVGVPDIINRIQTAIEESTPITITQPGGDMYRCALFEGTAGRRDGQQLWFAHRDALDPVHYFFSKPWLTGKNGWKTIVHLGRPDKVRSQFWAYAFYVSDDTSRFLEDLSTASASGPAPTYWMSRDFPPTAKGMVSIEVWRAGDPRDCPP